MQEELCRMVVGESVASALRLGATALLVRHAERGPIPDPTLGHDVPLTERGRGDARALGRELGLLAPITAQHSRVPRCEDTARLIVEGANEVGRGTLIGPTDALGGVYMLRGPDALVAARDHGSAFVRKWFDGELPEGLVVGRPEGARIVLTSALEHLSSEAETVAVLVTHDWNLMLVREEFFGVRHEEAGWFGYLDGIAVAREGDNVVLAYGTLVRRLHKDDLRESHP